MPGHGRTCRLGLLAAAVMAADAGAAITNDWGWVTNNLGRITGATNGAVALYPQLAVSPPRKTIFGGDTITFSVSGAESGTWFLVKGPSGGSIDYVNPTTITYQAGTTSSCIDIIQAWDGSNGFGRAYVNVISAAEAAQAGKAVVLAGRKSADDSLWPITDYLADGAYNVLTYRGYTKDNIQYVSPVTGVDVDGNGEDDDIDLETTLANAELTFTNWVNAANKLFVYMVDHGSDAGGQGYFRLNAAEMLAATQLCGWLDHLQNTYTTEVTVVIDCCYAGSLADELTYTGAAKRIVIASAGTNEAACFVAGGLVSFSDAFFSGIMLGYDVERAYEQAALAMTAYQEPVYDDNGDGHMASNVFLGASFVAGKDIPIIGTICGNQLIDEGTEAILWADDVVSAYGISRVWCLVIPPGYVVTNADNPVSEIPELDLSYSNQSGRYEARYPGFSQDGTYKVLYYAKDIWGSVSLPRQSYVIQSGYDERVVLVECGPTNLESWSSISNLATFSYHTLLSRAIPPDRIWHLSAVTNRDMDGDGTNDIRGAVTLDSVANAITNWAATTNWGGPADKLSVIVIGDGTNGIVRLNETNDLAPNDLAAWLNAYQVSNRQANVFIEADHAGVFLAPLAGYTNRISVVSSRTNQISVWSQDGETSFLHFFMRYAFRGYTIGSSFSSTKPVIKGATGKIRQEPLIDDNGNGVGNEKLVDGTMANTIYLGPAFVTGDDAPVIGAVMPDVVLAQSNDLVLWVADVTDADGISNVWCVVTPPDYEGVGDLPQTNLAWNAGESRYEALYTNFAVAGTYVCTFRAVDNQGEISTPVQALVGFGDAWEVDDAAGQASSFDVGDPQYHTFHASNDVDWTRFYCVTDYSYRVILTNIGDNVDAVLTIYVQEEDGTLTWLDSVDDSGSGAGESEMIILGPPPQDGWYYVEVSSFDGELYGPDSDYELSVQVDVGADLIVIAIDKLNTSKSPPNAKAIIDNVRTQSFGTANSIAVSGLSVGVHTVRVTTAAGFLPEESTNVAGLVQNLYSVDYGNPRKKNVTGAAGCASVFQFVPYARADGVVRDLWTGEWLQGAQLAFRAASGPAGVSGLVYRSYPGFASYATNWATSSDGAFPTNVLLLPLRWDMLITRTNYTNTVRIGAISNLVYAAYTNMGTIYMRPADYNGNHIADAWEAANFGAGSNVNASGDEDLDGHDNWREYILGTDPNDDESFLSCGSVVSNAGASFTVTWPVVRGRSYEVRQVSDLTNTVWTSLFGPESALSTGTMSWTDTNAGTRARSYYHIKVPLP